LHSVLVTRVKWKISRKVVLYFPCYRKLSLTFNVTSLSHAADIISTVEFDHTGDYLATGDKGGRVVLFERNDAVRIFNNSMTTGLFIFAL
jgi:hypothetical protein